MFDGLTHEDTLRIKRRIKYTVQFVTVVIITLVFANSGSYESVHSFFENSNEDSGIILSVIYSLIVLLAYYSLNRLNTVFNNEYRDNYFKAKDDDGDSFSKTKFIFRQKPIIIEFSIFALMYIILPIEFLNPIGYTLIYYFGSGILIKALYLLVMIPILLLVNILARRAAFAYWDKEKPKIDNYEVDIKKEDKKANKEYIKNLFILVIVYIIGITYGASLLYGVSNYLIKLFTLEWEILLKIIITVVSATVAFHLLRALRAINRRRKFIKALKKLCREKKYRLSKIKYPYKSIFSVYKGESFSVYNGKKQYSCKLIGGSKRHVPLRINHDGTGTFNITVRFLKADILSYDKNFVFGYEAECKKILIVNPVPKKCYTYFGSKLTELDNGDIIGNYKFYAAQGFLNALDRDVIDID